MPLVCVLLPVSGSVTSNSGGLQSLEPLLWVVVQKSAANPVTGGKGLDQSFPVGCFARIAPASGPLLFDEEFNGSALDSQMAPGNSAPDPTYPGTNVQSVPANVTVSNGEAQLSITD